LVRLVGVYERGADNHGARNWEKGLPLSRMIDSTIRHLIQWKMSKYMPELRDEDHLAHAAWNVLGIMHTEEMIERWHLPKKLDDMPRYEPQIDDEAEIDWEEAYEKASELKVMQSGCKCECGNDFEFPEGSGNRINVKCCESKIKEEDFDFTGENETLSDAKKFEKYLDDEAVEDNWIDEEARNLRYVEDARNMTAEEFKEIYGEYPDLNGLR